MMKKLLLLALISVAGSAAAQMAIPGASFADNPGRFNGRKVTVKDVKLNFSGEMAAPNTAVAPANLSGSIQMPSVAPGPNGNGTVVNRCNPPRGFKKVNVDFNAAPNYKGCFFMPSAMYDQLKREAGGQSVSAKITFRGDVRIGYSVTFYQLL